MNSKMMKSVHRVLTMVSDDIDKLCDLSFLIGSLTVIYWWNTYDDVIIYISVKSYFQQYFSYIVAVSFIGGGNHHTVASHWQTLSYNVALSTSSRHEWGANSQHEWWWVPIAQVVVNLTPIWSRPWWPLKHVWCYQRRNKV